MKIVSAAVLLSTLTACATVDPSSLGGNQFAFSSNSQSARDAVVAAGAAHGYRVSRSEDYVLMMEKPAYGFANSYAFGSAFNGTPNQRLSVTFVGSNPTRATASYGMVGNPGSAYERETDLTFLKEGRTEIPKIMRSAGASAVK